MSNDTWSKTNSISYSWLYIICSDDGNYVSGITIGGNSKDISKNTIVVSYDKGNTFQEFKNVPLDDNWKFLIGNSSFTSFIFTAGNNIYYFAITINQWIKLRDVLPLGIPSNPNYLIANKEYTKFAVTDISSSKFLYIANISNNGTPSNFVISKQSGIVRMCSNSTFNIFLATTSTNVLISPDMNVKGNELINWKVINFGNNSWGSITADLSLRKIFVSYAGASKIYCSIDGGATHFVIESSSSIQYNNFVLNSAGDELLAAGDDNQTGSLYFITNLNNKYRVPTIQPTGSTLLGFVAAAKNFSTIYLSQKTPSQLWRYTTTSNTPSINYPYISTNQSNESNDVPSIVDSTVFMRGNPYNFSNSNGYYIVGRDNKGLNYVMTSDFFESTNKPKPYVFSSASFETISPAALIIFPKHINGNNYTFGAPDKKTFDITTSGVLSFSPNINNPRQFRLTASNTMKGNSSNIYPSIWYVISTEDSVPIVYYVQNCATNDNKNFCTSLASGTTTKILSLMFIPKDNMTLYKRINNECYNVPSDSSDKDEIGIKWFYNWITQTGDYPQNCDTGKYAGTNSLNCYFSDKETCTNGFLYYIGDGSAKCSGNTLGYCNANGDEMFPCIENSKSVISNLPPYECSLVPNHTPNNNDNKWYTNLLNYKSWEFWLLWIGVLLIIIIIIVVSVYFTKKKPNKSIDELVKNKGESFNYINDEIKIENFNT